MKTMRIPRRSKTICNLLQEARKGEVLLYTPEGEVFVLAFKKDWGVFDVGNGNFKQEVKNTANNKNLAKFMAERRRRNRGKGIPLSEVKKQLGLD